MFKSMPRFDSLFVPGGDGGLVLAPAAMLAAVKNLTTLMRGYHPGASVWVSAQDYSSANLTAFMNVVAQPDVRQWLTGVVYGPHVHVPLTEFLDMVPDGMPVRQYPDLCHMIETQFPVPAWDPAWALTYRRQAVNPSPERYYGIVALRTNATYVSHSLPGGSGGRLIGFGAYSEGVADDLNKVIWSAFGSEGATRAQIVDDYVAYFFEAPVAEHMVGALYGLEANWRGTIAASNQQVARTLSQVVAAWAAASSTAQASNWRLQMYLMRGYYDAYVSARVAYAAQTEAMVRAALAVASTGAVGTSPASALAAASHVLSERATAEAADPQQRVLYRGVTAAVAAINASIGAFVVCDQQPDLSTTTINASVSDVPFLTAAVAEASGLASPAAQLAAIGAVLSAGVAPPGGWYDRLGSVDASQHPHLVGGEGAHADPSFYFTPLQGVDTRTDGTDPAYTNRLAQRSYTMSHFDASVTLVYDNLPTAGLAGYNVTLTMYRAASTKPPTTARLVINGDVVRPYSPAPLPIVPLSYVVPASSVEAAGGSIVLSCNQPPGLEGSGRCCFLSEVYVAPVSA